METNKTLDEKIIIRVMIYNELVQEKLIDVLIPEMFSDGHIREIYGLIHSFYQKYGKFPDKNLEILIMDNVWQQEAELIKIKLDIIKPECPESFKNIDLEPFYSEMEKWIKRAKFGLCVKDGANIYSGNSKKDMGEVAKNMQTAISYSIHDDEWICVDDDNVMDDILLSKDEMVPLDWPEWNKFFGGGLKKKSLTIIQAGTHGGKSRFMLSMASAVRRYSPDQNTLYVTLEMPKEDLSRFSLLHDLEMSREEAKELRINNPKIYEEKRSETKKAYGSQYIVEYPGYSVSAKGIENLLKVLERKGIQISVVFVDYLMLLNPTSKWEGTYDKGIKNSVELRTIPQKKSIPVVTAAQPTREGNRKNMKTGMGADMMDAGDSKGLPDTTDIFINITSTIEDRRNNKQFAWVLKNRVNGRTYEGFVIDVSEKIPYRIDITGTSSLIEKDPDEEDQEIISMIHRGGVNGDLGVPDFSQPAFN